MIVFQFIGKIRLLMLHVEGVLSYAQSPNVLCRSCISELKLFRLFVVRLTLYSECLFVIYNIADVFPSV